MLVIMCLFLPIIEHMDIGLDYPHYLCSTVVIFHHLKIDLHKKKGGGYFPTVTEYPVVKRSSIVYIYIALTKVRLIKICYQKLYFYFLKKRKKIFKLMGQFLKYDFNFLSC